jgi:hypothetical protein
VGANGHPRSVSASSGEATWTCYGGGMSSRHVNGTNGTGRRAVHAPRRQRVTRAQQEARRTIVAASGLSITPEEVAAVLETLRPR